ncbi:MAG: hypothetical protein F6K55_15270 [Moorea sp. SIO4A3]|nr:hypothetical protein [Moorena sp. SIO4A3]
MLIEHNTKNYSHLLTTLPCSLFPIAYCLLPIAFFYNTCVDNLDTNAI